MYIVKPTLNEWAFLIICPFVCLPSVCKLFTFSSSSPEPLGQFQPNLAQSIPAWRRFTFVQTEGPRIFLKWDTCNIIIFNTCNNIFLALNQIWCLKSSLQIKCCFYLSRKYRRIIAEEKTQGFLKRSFILRSPFTLRSRLPSVCFAFWVRSAFAVYIYTVSFTKFHYGFTHRSLCVRSAFIYRSLSVCSPMNCGEMVFISLICIATILESKF